jgi:hypothetical protein
MLVCNKRQWNEGANRKVVDGNRKYLSQKKTAFIWNGSNAVRVSLRVIPSSLTKDDDLWHSFIYHWWIKATFIGHMIKHFLQWL